MQLDEKPTQFLYNWESANLKCRNKHDVLLYRWVEQDPREILTSVKTCMQMAVLNLTALNMDSRDIRGELSEMYQ